MLISTVHAAALGGLVRLPADSATPSGHLEIGVIARGEIALDERTLPVPDEAVVEQHQDAAEPAQPQASQPISAPEREPQAIEARTEESEPDTQEQAKTPLPEENPTKQSVAQAIQTTTSGGSTPRASAQRIGAEDRKPEASHSARARYAALVSAEINRHKHYPAEARRRGERGVVGVAFQVGPSGTILSHSITQSSGSGALDAAANRMVAAARLPPPPGGAFRGTILITFRVAP